MRACEAYLGVCPVGAYVDPEDEKKKKEEEEEDAEESRGGGGGEITEAEEPPAAERAPPSWGFKLLLEKLLPKLRAAFEENSALAR